MVLGLELALMGMGTVFIFLILLILLTSTMSIVVNYFEPSKANEHSLAGLSLKPKFESNSLHPDISDKTLKQVITLALEQHRNKNKQ